MVNRAMGITIIDNSRTTNTSEYNKPADATKAVGVWQDLMENRKK